MKVAFAYIDPSYREMGPFHIGIASLIACLQQAGHACCFFHLMGDVDEGDFGHFLERNRPDVAAFSVTTNAFAHLPALAAQVRRSTDAFTVCGGVHATLCPDEVMAVDGVDAVCIGEGEGALLELCDRLQAGQDVRDIENLWVRDGEAVRCNRLRPLVQDLDSLPPPDRQVFPFAQSFDMRFMRRGVFMASRGCPYNCTYCCSPAVKRLYGGSRYIRFRSPEGLVQEVERVARDFPDIEYNVFHDDLLPMRKGWFEEFTRLYRRRVKLPFEMNCHPSLMDGDIARMAREAGCGLIRFGIESGNERLRRRVLGRNMSNRRIIEAFSCCDEAGIRTLSYDMIGLPFETRGDILDTVRLNARVRPQVPHVSVFYPYPGTEAYELCRREGFLTERQTDSYYEESVLQQPGVSAGQLRWLRRRFEGLVRLYSRCYALPPPLGWLARRLLDIGVLAASDRRLLRLTERLRKGQPPDDGCGPCYVLDGGEVRVWGAD